MIRQFRGTETLRSRDFTRLFEARALRYEKMDSEPIFSLAPEISGLSSTFSFLTRGGLARKLNK